MRGWCAFFALAACAGGAPNADGPTVDTDPVVDTEPPEPVDPEPQPLVPPPALAAAPDGTEMKPCADAPPGMGCVPGGKAIRGSDRPHTCPQGEIAWIPADQPNYAGPAEIWVSTFYMDETEVTYAAYQACVRTGSCKRAGPTYDDYDRPEQPMTGANYYKAQEYCRAMGKHLPTEAEWEKAARGPDGDLYPWGDEAASCDKAVLRDDRGRSCGVAKQGRKGGPEKGRTWEVARLKPYRYGLYDMIGNGEEWTADWNSRSYTACGDDCLGTDPKGPCGGGDNPCGDNDHKVVRGGSWYWGPECATSVNRRPHFAANKPFHHFGFRCAASSDEGAALVQAQRDAIAVDWPQREGDLEALIPALEGLKKDEDLPDTWLSAIATWAKGVDSLATCGAFLEDYATKRKAGADVAALASNSLRACPSSCLIESGARLLEADEPTTVLLETCDQQRIDPVLSGGPVRFRKWMAWSDYWVARSTLELLRDRYLEVPSVRSARVTELVAGLKVELARELARDHLVAAALAKVPGEATQADRDAAVQGAADTLRGPVAPPPDK